MNHNRKYQKKEREYQMNKYIEELNKRYNMNLRFIYNEENILIQNLKEYLSKSEYIKIDSFNDEREEYIFYIRKDNDSEYLKYNIRFIYEEIKIFQSNNYKEYEIYRYEEYNNLEIFSMNIYIFEYEHEILLTWKSVFTQFASLLGWC